MAKVIRPVIGAVAKTSKQIYAIINGVHRKVKKAYVIVNGVTRSTWLNAKGVILTGSTNGVIVSSNLENASNTTRLMENGTSSSYAVRAIESCNNKIFIARSERLYTYNSDNTLTQISKASGVYSADVPQIIVYNEVSGYYFITEFDSDDSPRTTCYYTKDLSTWTKIFAYQHIRAMFCYDKYLFVAKGLNYGSSDTIIERRDTTNLNTSLVSSPTFFDEAVLFMGYLNGYIIGYQGGDKKRICYCNATSDLSSWNYVSVGSYMDSTYGIQSMRILNGQIILCNYSRILFSSNITTWKSASGFANGIFDVGYYDGKYYIVGESGRIVTSTDLSTWTTLASTSGHVTSKILVFPVNT